MNKTTLDLDIPERHPCYADHFPGNPLVPGALLLQWIFLQIKKAYPGISICEVNSAKFLNAVLPGNHCQLAIEMKPDTSVMRIKCSCDGKVACIGKLTVNLLKCTAS